ELPSGLVGLEPDGGAPDPAMCEPHDGDGNGVVADPGLVDLAGGGAPDHGAFRVRACELAQWPGPVGEPRAGKGQDERLARIQVRKPSRPRAERKPERREVHPLLSGLNRANPSTS